MKNKDYLSLRQIQLEEFLILDHIIEIIEKNNLRYSLIGGTLLGAIRHKGFIPWDDDIDIAMPRTDYDKFIKLFNEQNKKVNMVMECPEHHNSFQPFCKIVNTKIQIKDGSISDQNIRYLWVDVFPVDVFPVSEKECQRMSKRIHIYAKLIYIHYLKNQITLGGGLKKYIGRLLIKPIAFFVTPDSITKLAKKTPYDKGEFVGNIVWGYGPQERIKKSDYNEFIDIEFEGKKFKSIKNYKYYLENVYGDYMKLPPVEKRVTHNIKAWYVE